jgi:hypothetical protein
MLPETFQPSRESPVFSFMILQKMPNLTNTYTCSTAVSQREWTNTRGIQYGFDRWLSGPFETLVGLYRNKLVLRSAQLVSYVGASARSPSLDVSLSSHKDVKVASASKYMIDSLLYLMAQVNFSFTFGSMAIKKVKNMSTVNIEVWWVFRSCFCRLWKAPS